MYRRPHYERSRSVPARARRMLRYGWIIATLAVPVLGGALIVSSLPVLTADTTQETYSVQSGDTLGVIALRYGVTVNELVQANGLADPDVIYVGQTLVIPREQPQAAVQATHTIQVGESLPMIARRYNVTVEAIMATNGLPDRNSITAGQQLTIPPASGQPAQTTQDATYIVGRGDSLYRISLIFGVTVDDLLAANNLSSPSSVYPGLVLRVPAPQPEVEAAPPVVAPPTAGPQTGGLSYTVRIGDTLTAIALRFQVTVDGLIAANGLVRPDSIYIGQLLSIPEAGATARAYPAQTAVSHTVRQGETLSAIAIRYGVTVHSLSLANGISNPSRIFIGQVLSIPTAQAGSSSVRYASVGDGLCVNIDPTLSGTGYFSRPSIDYVVSQSFLPWHAGIDLAQETGSPVYSADSGTVVFSGWNPAGYGNLIVLDHGNGWRSYYAHLSEIYVACGDFVPRGSIIGAVGSTGNSTGPHLHFELLRFGIAVNPVGYIRF